MLPGSTIPIVRVVGIETVIEGQLDRKGLVRALKDPQRMYNYNSSSAVEQVAAQGKSPYVTALEAIEGFETYWATANRVNHAYLPFKHRDKKGQEIPPPARQNPPVMSEAYVKGMEIAQQEMMMASGQYQAQLGENENAKSGKAIAERQRQGDNATYHFIDNLAIAIRRTGKILLELIPKVYDTQRIIRILAEDGTDHEVEIDPTAAQAYARKQAENEEDVRAIFNPNIGLYDVEADTGPAYATRRQEAWNAFMQIIPQAKELMSIAGDLVFQAADFPMADELAERLKRMVPPQALGKGPSPEVVQAQQTIVGLQNALKTLTEQLTEQKIKLVGKDQQKDIDVFEAITDRLKVMLPTILNPKDIAGMVHDLIVQEHGARLDQVTAASAPQLADASQEGQGQPARPQSAPTPDQAQQAPGAQQPPMPGARQAPDGEWYVTDPQGQHYRVAA
jgi:Phage P22-like portal protein